MRILFLSRWFPFPTNNGSKLRIFHLLQGISRQHEVFLISFFDPSEAALDITRFKAICKKIWTVEWEPFDPNSRPARFGFLSSKPRSIIDTFSVEMRDTIRDAISEFSIEMVIASQIDMAAYGPYLSGLPAIFEEIEVGVLYEQYSRSDTSRHKLRYGLTWLKQRHFLKTCLKHYRLATVVSEREKLLVHKHVNENARIEVIPNCVDLAQYGIKTADPLANSLIFTGSFTFHPNYEGMFWFTQQVLPLIRKHVQDVQLTITGNHDGFRLPDMQGVRLTGYVDDVRPLISQSWCNIVPLHSGGGTRLKILESMALGTPVVATSKGAEGLDVENGVHLLIADTAEEFAGAILQLLVDDVLCHRLTENAYELVRTNYDWTKVMPRFLEIVEKSPTLSTN